MSDNDISPALTHMSQGNHVSLHVGSSPISRDEREEFRGDLIDRRKVVLDGPNQAKDFNCILLKAVDL